MSRTLHLFGTDSCATVVPIRVIRWYRMQCYDRTDSCATVVPIRRYCHLILQVEVSNGKFPNTPQKSFLTRSEAYLPQIRLSQLVAHTCIGRCEAVFQCPNYAQLSSGNTSAVVKPLFLTSEGKMHVNARLAHYGCNKQSFTMRVSNGYTYYEDKTVLPGWQDYVGDIPLAFSDGRTELLSFTYL